MYVDVLKVQLVASEVDIYFQMTNQLSTQSSIMKINNITSTSWVWGGGGGGVIQMHSAFRHIETS